MVAEIRIAREALQAFVEQLFVRAGVPPEDAHTEAEVLMWASVRGVDSHGILLVPGYVDNLLAGNMNPKPNIRVEMETPAALLIEADRALGAVVTVQAMKQVMAKARQMAIGWALIRNTMHQGAMGYYARMAALEGMAGITFVCNPPNMAPYGARAAGVHNSPIAFAVPAQTHPPMILDMATSTVAAGWVNLAIDKGIPIPEGWAIDKDGRPTTDPTAVGALLPFGGYKASGLAMMLAALSTVMAGNPIPEAIPTGKGTARRWTQNSVVAAVNIAAFTDVERYKQEIDHMIEGINALPPAEGFSEVMTPGQPEERNEAERSRSGIPVPMGTVEKLRRAAGKVGAEVPELFREG